MTPINKFRLYKEIPEADKVGQKVIGLVLDPETLAEKADYDLRIRFLQELTNSYTGAKLHFAPMVIAFVKPKPVPMTYCDLNSMVRRYPMLPFLF